jgi:hypothetical protein
MSFVDSEISEKILKISENSKNLFEIKICEKMPKFFFLCTKAFMTAGQANSVMAHPAVKKLSNSVEFCPRCLKLSSAKFSALLTH